MILDDDSAFADDDFVADDEWEETEEIEAEEIDQVIEAITALMESTPSKTIRDILEAACCDLAELIELDDDQEQAA